MTDDTRFESTALNPLHQRLLQSTFTRSLTRDLQCRDRKLLSGSSCDQEEDSDNELDGLIEAVITVQAMIDINVQHLHGLRTECALTAELTQNEIRSLEVCNCLYSTIQFTLLMDQSRKGVCKCALLLF